MEHIAPTLNVPRPQTKHRTKEGERISEILEKLNPPRIAEGYEPFTFPAMRKILKGWNAQMLSVVIANCDEAEKGGFPWSIKFWIEYKKRRPLKQSKLDI